MKGFITDVEYYSARTWIFSFGFLANLYGQLATFGENNTNLAILKEV